MVQHDPRRLGRIALGVAAAGDSDRFGHAGPCPAADTGRAPGFGRTVGQASNRQGIDPLCHRQVGVVVEPGRQLIVGGDMVGVEQSLELDLAQQDAIIGLTRRNTRQLQITAPQGVEGGCVAQAVGVAQGLGLAIVDHGFFDGRLAGHGRVVSLRTRRHRPGGEGGQNYGQRRREHRAAEIIHRRRPPRATRLPSRFRISASVCDRSSIANYAATRHRSQSRVRQGANDRVNPCAAQCRSLRRDRPRRAAPQPPEHQPTPASWPVRA